jgi:hypothetical protein
MDKKLAIFGSLFLVAAVGAWLVQVDVVRAGPGSLAGLWHLDQDSGLTATDSSGNGNDGTLFGGATFTNTAKFGEHAVSFDGVDDFISVPDGDMSLNPPNAITAEAWIRITANGLYPSVISKGNVGNYAESYALFVDPSGVLGFLVNTAGNSGGRGIVITGPAIPLNTWVHVAGTYDGVNVKTYLNGVQVGIVAHTGLIYQLLNDVLIGKSDRTPSSDPDSFFNGKIDEVRIWNRALGANEVLASAQAGLRALWHFNETAPSPTTADDSGYTNTGTPQNGATFDSGVNANFGNALKLDGTDDFVRIPSSPVLEPAQITVELWVKSAAPGPFAYLVAKGSQGCSSASYSINSSGAGGGLAFDVWNGTTPFRSPFTPTSVFNGIWHHVAGTFDGAFVRIYVDGVQEGSGTPVTSGFTINYDLPTTTDLLFGNYDAGGACSLNFHYSGLLDEAHIWARALSPQEIAFIANKTGPTATWAELIVPGEISQELGSGAVFGSNWHYSGPGLTQHAMGLEFIVSNDDNGSTIINGPTTVPPCATDRGSTPGTPTPGGLLGCETGIGGKSALISGKQVDVTTGKKTGPSKTLHLHVNLSDGSHLGTNIQWR